MHQAVANSNDIFGQTAVIRATVVRHADVQQLNTYYFLRVVKLRCLKLKTERHAAHIKTNVTWDDSPRCCFIPLIGWKFDASMHTSVRCIGEINQWIKQRTLYQYFFRLRICWRHCLRKVKIYQQTEFHPNRTTRGEDMTSYRFSRWPPLLLTVFCLTTLSANQISSTYLNSRLRYSYFRFGKTDVCKNKRPPYWNFSFGCDVDCIAVIRMSFCIRVPNFIQIAPPAARIWRHINF